MDSCLICVRGAWPRVILGERDKEEWRRMFCGVWKERGVESSSMYEDQEVAEGSSPRRSKQGCEMMVHSPCEEGAETCAKISGGKERVMGWEMYSCAAAMNCGATCMLIKSEDPKSWSKSGDISGGYSAETWGKSRVAPLEDGASSCANT